MPARSSAVARPRGLWKARVNATPRSTASGKKIPDRKEDAAYRDDSDSTDDELNAQLGNYALKKRRHSQSTSDTASLSPDDDDDELYYWDFSRQCSPRPERTRTRPMDTSAISGRGTQEGDTNCDYDDWVELKELFSKAAEQYENADAPESLPLLRGVIHECHRFLLTHPDPSVIFFNPHPPHEQPSTRVPPLPNLPISPHIWSAGPHSTVPPITVHPRPGQTQRCQCSELPTAFHAILGTALFLFGNLIAQESTLALEGEPNNPTPYWLAALDVFETGENVPSRTSGATFGLPEDWRMAIVWGRTLVCVADEMVTRARQAKQAAAAAAATPSSPSGAAEVAPPTTPKINFIADDIVWPRDSPLTTIVAQRPRYTTRMSLANATPHDLMMLAMDQFSRGIFHMPHPHHRRLAARPPLASSSSSASIFPHTLEVTETPSGLLSAPLLAPPRAPAPPAQETFSRAKELFTVASEVLLLAEKLETPFERKKWASWADSVFNQMKMEADTDTWRGPITRARGRCWLIIGSAPMETLEAALERDDPGVLDSDEAKEARKGLKEAIQYFERAKGSATANSSGQELEELKPLMVEALLTLGNLTEDIEERRALYARAREEAGDLDLGLMDSDDEMDDGERMDEA